MVIVIGSCMNLLVITNMYSHRSIYNSLHKIHSIVFASKYTGGYQLSKFCFDMEFTNGNYYLADILEIAMVAEESGNVFHSYVKIHLQQRLMDVLNFYIVNKRKVKRFRSLEHMEGTCMIFQFCWQIV